MGVGVREGNHRTHMKIISVFRHAESCIGANEARYIEGEGCIVGEGFANKREICIFPVFHKTTGSHEAIETVPLHSLYLPLEMSTSRLLMRNTTPESGYLLLQAWVLVPFLLDQHDNPFEGWSWGFLVDCMLIYSAQLGRPFSGFLVFFIIQGQEIVF